MKGDAETGGVRPGRAQQLGRLVERCAELAGQVVDRAALGQGEAHEQTQHRRIADEPDRHRLLQDLRQLVRAVEREIGHAIHVEGVADCRPRLDRVHEMDLGRRQQLADERHLGERGAIEMANAAGPQRPQHARLGVALDGVENIARKELGKPPRGAGDHRRAQAQQRIARPRPGNDRIDRGESSAPLRAGREKTGLRHRTILRNQEATCRSARQKRRRRNDRSG